MTKILIVGCVEFASDYLGELQMSYTVDHLTSRDRQEFIKDCQTKYKDTTLLYRTPESEETVGLFDQEIVECLPASLKFIAHCGAGYDSIDVEACKRRGIMVSHTPVAVDDGTADTTVLLILACCRNILAANDNLRSGRFRSGLSMGIDVQDKVLGIIGAGGIGKTVARRMAGFDLKKIQYYNRTRLSPKVEEKYGLSFVDFKSLLETSDIISIHCPHTPQTTHLIDYKEFTWMKQGVVVVNTARGKVINEAALVKALERGQVLAAGLDVFEQEPQVHPGLLTHPRSVLLPHIGTFTPQSQHKMEKLALDNLVHAIQQNSLLTPVPEHKNWYPFIINKR